MNEEMIDRVSRPSRYIGREINTIHKNPHEVEVKIALAFPDTYEIGMSHLGLKILYDILNRREDTLAERVYAPWKDMETVLRSEGRPLTTLESSTSPAEFDLIGFTLQYEMSYTNILNMLDLAGLPLRATERDERHPLIVGGGPCAFNPEPLSDFFDLFVIGDGEEVLHEIIEVFRTYRVGTRSKLLQELARLEGIYVPAHFSITYHNDGRIAEIRNVTGGKDRIHKRLVTDLNATPYPCAPILPYMKTVHDRVALEISRGCTQGCRFCQAGMIYRPVRERKIGTLLDILERSVESTGHEEASLTSLSSGDYTALPQLVDSVLRFAEERHIGVSLPSLRPGTLTAGIIEAIRKVRKTGFTIAPEAGTQRLRDVINKGIGEEEIFDTLRKVFEAGWESIKLYFMIGLPTETGEDLQGIVDLVHRALKVARIANPKLKRISVSLSPFVPKPHTPFQWSVQDSPDEINKKYEFLKKHLKNRKIQIKWHDPEISMLEGIISRGDRRIGRVLQAAWEEGCRFDGWTEEFDPAKWESAFRKEGIDPAFYLYRNRACEEVLPWDLIDTGISRDFLKEEFNRALRTELTPDCRKGTCSLCGVCTKEIRNVFAEPPEEKNPRSTLSSRKGRISVKRFRVRYSRKGRLRFLSHLEMISVILRSFARAAISLEYSKGFHPHPKIAMGPALPVGVEGNTEYFDVNVEGTLFEEPLSERLNRVLPEGIRITGVNWIPHQAPAISSIIRFGEYRMELPKDLVPLDPRRKVQDFLDRTEIPFTRRRKRKEKRFDLKPMIGSLKVVTETDNSFSLVTLIRTGDQGGLRPDELLRALFDLSEENLQRIRILRTGLFTDREKSSPFEERLVQPA
ncbi:MAG: TIGR03960 family B12-binding radical SAM protein [Deltaproteobacteria bacterium]|nr:TIGR03960 family B12-binding radical SAM protein [Deltaproteobacteria bacterium]